MEESVTDEITDFRSLTYSLADEEAAKQLAVAEAMRRAVGRANAALEQKGQKVGALRFASLDVKQLVGVAQLNVASLQTVEVEGAVNGRARNAVAPPTSTPTPAPTGEDHSQRNGAMRLSNSIGKNREALPAPPPHRSFHEKAG